MKTFKTTTTFTNWPQAKRAIALLSKKKHELHVESLVYTEVGPENHRLEVVFKKIS